MTAINITSNTIYDKNNLPDGFVLGKGNTVVATKSIIADAATVTFKDLNIVVESGGSNDYLFRTINGGNIKLGVCLNEDEFFADPKNVEPIIENSCTYYETTGSTFDLYQNNSSEKKPGSFYMFGGMAYSQRNGDIRSHHGSINLINIPLKNVEIYTSYNGLLYGVHSYATNYGFSDYQGKIINCRVTSVDNLIDNRFLAKDYRTVYRGLKATINTNMLMVQTNYQTTLGLIDIDFNNFNINGDQSKTLYQFARSVNIKTNVPCNIEQILNDNVVQSRDLYSDTLVPTGAKYQNRELHLLLYRRVNGNASLAETNSDFKIAIRELGYKEKSITLNGLTKENSTTSGFKYDINLIEDKDYSNTDFSSDITISTSAELYDAIHQVSVENLDTNITYSIDGNTVKTDVNIVFYGDLVSPATPVTYPHYDKNTNTITVHSTKFIDNIIQTSANTIEVKNGALITGLYKDRSGDIKLKVNVAAENGIKNIVYGAWLKSQGKNNRVGIVTSNNENGTLYVNPNTDYYVVADGVNAIRSEVFEVNSRDFGNEINIKLARITKVGGINLLPESLTSEQEYISNMFNYDRGTRGITITLPIDYQTNERWDSASKNFVLLSNDCIPIQYKAEQIQSSEASLQDPITVKFRDKEIVLPENSHFKFVQDKSNPDCIINMTSFTIRRELDERRLNTFIDNSNGDITVNAGVPIIANINMQNPVAETAVDNPESSGSSTILTTEKFKLRFPEFISVDDARIQIFIDDAILAINKITWGTQYDLAVYYLSAHYLALSEESSNGNSSSIGSVASQGVDGTSISFNTYSPNSASQAYFLSTQYGQKFYLLFRTLGSMAFTV